jgi:hypothetical protein
MAGLKAEETRERQLAADLAALGDSDGSTVLDARQIKAELVERAADVRAPCEPFREDGEVGYRFAVRASFGALLTGPTNGGVPDGTLTLFVFPSGHSPA